MLIRNRAVVSLLLGATPSIRRVDWPQFRGPGGRGGADVAKLRGRWSTRGNVAWNKIKIKGR